MGLDLSADGAALTAALTDIESVSGAEQAAGRRDRRGAPAAAAPDRAHRRRGGGRPHLAGRSQRVILAGHIDTVPVAGNLPAHTDAERFRLYGCGTADMKSGVAIQLRLAAALASPVMDVTYVFYDCEEVEAERNGLLRGSAAASPGCWPATSPCCSSRPAAWSRAAARARCGPTSPRRGSGRTARGPGWARNAIHEAAGRSVLRAYQPRTPDVDGLTYREGLNAVAISGGIAGNVIPDRCDGDGELQVRAGPDRRAGGRPPARGVRRVAGDGARHRAGRPARPRPAWPPPPSSRRSVATPRAKLGWTDVARFAELGIPAVNYGPGEPEVAHSRGEYVEIPKIGECEARMHAWLAGERIGLTARLGLPPAAGRAIRRPAAAIRRPVRTAGAGRGLRTGPPRPGAGLLTCLRPGLRGLACVAWPAWSGLRGLACVVSPASSGLLGLAYLAGPAASFSDEVCCLPFGATQVNRDRGAGVVLDEQPWVNAAGELTAWPLMLVMTEPGGHARRGRPACRTAPR